jgi:hypothetical protein
MLKKGGDFPKVSSLSILWRGGIVFVIGLLGWGCSILATRPVQEMSDTAAALRAAKEVQADVLAPELFRKSNEWFFRARHEYKFKNFKLAKEYAYKARFLAEQAEFEALKNGGIRGEQGAGPDPLANATPTASPYPYPTPEGTPADAYDQRKVEDESKKTTGPQAPPVPSPVPT